MLTRTLVICDVQKAGAGGGGDDAESGVELARQCTSWGDLKAAYRLLSNEAIDPHALEVPHQEYTRSICHEHPVVLCVQDDTRLRRCDHMLHSTLAVLPNDRLLGILQQYFFQRIVVPKGETHRQCAGRWRESCVWADATCAIGSGPSNCRFIHVADRGSDNLHFMKACTEFENVGFVIRANHDRRIRPGHLPENEAPLERLWLHLQSQTPCSTMLVQVGTQRDAGGRILRRGREVEVVVRFAAVTLEPPRNRPCKHPPRPVWAVTLQEADPPPDVDAIEWVLLTSKKIADAVAAERIIGYYSKRWVIEEWHRALKEGCRLELSQLDEAADHLRLTSILSMIAVRLLQLRDLADPNHESASDAEMLRRWAPPMWIAVVAKVGKYDASSLMPQQFMLVIAKRGGYIGRKSDPRPGWKVLWAGWYEISILAEGAELASQLPKPHNCG